MGSSDKRSALFLKRRLTAEEEAMIESAFDAQTDHEVQDLQMALDMINKEKVSHLTSLVLFPVYLLIALVSGTFSGFFNVLKAVSQEVRAFRASANFLLTSNNKHIEQAVKGHKDEMHMWK